MLTKHMFHFCLFSTVLKLSVMEGSGSGWPGDPLPSCCLSNITMENSSVGRIYEVVVQSTNGTTKRNPQFVGVELLQSFKPLIIPCYALVVLVGVFGNYLLLYVICHTRKMHNVTNFFIGNLAFSDMLMCATCVPFTLAYAFNPRGWVFGRFMCYLVFLIQPVTVYVSVFTLTAIGVDRWVIGRVEFQITGYFDVTGVGAGRGVRFTWCNYSSIYSSSGELQESQTEKMYHFVAYQLIHIGTHYCPWL